jgi:hypothetical protein
MANTAAQKNQLARINRKLAVSSQKVFTSSKRERYGLGDFHIVDTYRNEVVLSDINLDAIEKDLACHDPWWMDRCNVAAEEL